MIKHTLNNEYEEIVRKKKMRETSGNEDDDDFIQILTDFAKGKNEGSLHKVCKLWVFKVYNILSFNN